MSEHGRVRALTATVVALAASLALAASASAANSLSTSTYASGFAVSAKGLGPIGIALDNDNNLFILDSADGFLYRFNGPGGVAGASTRLGSTPVSSNPGGLAFDGAGHLYAARYNENQVVQLDPNTGAILRVVAGVTCADGLAYDATSDSLLVTNCGTTLVRIASPQSASPHASAFAQNIHGADGVAIAPDGTIYLDEEGSGIDRVGGVNSAAPGVVTRIATVTHADGISVGNGFLFINRTDGVITRLALSNAKTQDVVTGGTRGDFSAVGIDGCLYATQTRTVIRVTDTDGSCNNLGGAGGLSPTTPGTSKGDDLPSKHGCLDRRRFTFHLHHGAGATVVRVSVFVNGKRRVHTSGTDIKTVTLKRLPQKKFRVRVVSLHSNGSSLISTRTYKGCTKSKPKTRRHSHK
jgi:hypothetical protein